VSGNEALIIDLRYLLDDALNYEFDDFKTSEATPRINLERRLKQLIDNNRNGKYDA